LNFKFSQMPPVPRVLAIAWLFLACVVCAPVSPVASPVSGSTISPFQAHTWCDQLGWIVWRPDPAHGARLGEFVCSGYIYSANAGWIHLGTGTPENGIHYQNDSASDYGINHDQEGNLRGFAYGANLGWIHFEEEGAPRIDLATGLLSGSVYSANAGWIHLSNDPYFLRTDSIAPGTDSDGDGIPDAWELIHAGNLTLFDGFSDSDQDGSTDLQEYLAGTDPLDPEDRFIITAFSLSSDRQRVTLTFSSRANREYLVATSQEIGPQPDWFPLSSLPELGNGETLSLTVTNEQAVSHGFFRIQALRPLR
jgi:hypothetical protein